VRDAWPVTCEEFTQWVLEDEFTSGRPPLEHAGVQLVDRAGPYELVKLRLLNAGHQALAYFGYLAGHRFVADAAADPLLAAFFRHYADEVRPTLPVIDGLDVDAYREQLLLRFTNPAIGDALERICAYSSDRIPKFVLPAAHENLVAGRDVRCAAAVVAAWARYCEGQDDEGRPIELVDPLAESLRARARAQQADPLAFLADRDLFGGLIEHPAFTEPYRATLEALHDRGSRAALAALARDRTG
jgi:mannitol 2-dehydrogenase